MGNALEGAAGHVDVMIIGGGPTGLGAAFRLNQHNSKSWVLLDAEKQPGGLAGSVRTHEGFRFDHGFKTFCSRYEYIDRLLKECYGDNSLKIQNKVRDSYVYVRGRFVRYPLQNNLSGLPYHEKLACSLDLLRARISDMQETDKNSVMSTESINKLQDNYATQDDVLPLTSQNIDRISSKVNDPKPVDGDVDSSETLDEYLLRRWGESLCNVLFRPYVFKSFAYPTSKLSSKWAEYKILPSNMGADIERILQNEQCDPGLDSESTTIYPCKGGLVSLWKTIVRKLPKDNVRFKSEITDLDIETKTVKTKDGLEITYDSLISTMPLNSLLQLAGREDLNDSLTHSSLFIICLGIRGRSPHKDITGCVYFPEADCVFHRACIFSSFDPESVPDESERIGTMRMVKPDEYVASGNSGGPYWSLMLEVSAGPLKTISEATIVDEAIRDACSVGLLRGNDEIVSLHMTEMTHGQPLPTRGTETKVDEALKWLQSKGIYSRGRFGSFKYHMGDLDHCFIQGVEAADNITIQSPENCVWRSPSDMDNRCGVKMPNPVFDVSLPSDDSDEGINAGDVRNAITSEPSCSSSSFTSSSTAPISRASSQHGSAQATDSE